MNSKGNKNFLSLSLFLLVGVALGGFLGHYLAGFKYADWLNFGRDFGLASPLTLDLGVISLSFQIVFKINVASIIGLIVALVSYKKFC